jgi:hypothetical protein
LAPLTFAQLSPPAVANPSDNLKNLFEIPVLFYILVLYLSVTQQVDTLYVTAAWIFVAFRVLQSVVHCTFNFILLRFSPYLIATQAVRSNSEGNCWPSSVNAGPWHFRETCGNRSHLLYAFTKRLAKRATM